MDPLALLEPLSEKLLRITPQAASEPLIVALEIMPGIIRGFYGEADKVHIETILPAESSPDTVPIPPIDEDKSLEGDHDEILVSLLGEWLQFYGPRSADFIHTTLGIENRRLVLALEDLIESGKIIMGRLLTEGSDDDICDSENFEILLRLSRADAIPLFEPVDIEWLPLFLATYQRIADPGDNIDGLFRRMEQLLCYNMQAGIWESDILPARLRPYDTSWLDTIMQEGDLRWIGRKKQDLAFCFESDLDLMQEEAGDSGAHREVPDQETDATEDLFPDSAGRYNFSTLLRISKCRPSELSDRLWNAVWQGRVTNDTFICIRRGIENRFSVPNVAAMNVNARSRSRRSGGRANFSRWKGSLPFAGNWFRLSRPELSEDLLDVEERKKDRVRLLLDRYGILFRELLLKELPPFRWAGVFRSLRLMELSGELLAGCFFHGIPGPQFISHQAFRLLQRKLPEEKIYWINATDPASLCGIQLDAIRGTLPKRVDSTHLVYRSNKLVLVSRGNGRALRFYDPPEDPGLQRYLGPLRHLLTRQFQPLRRITIEKINGEEAARSAYVDALRTSFEVVIDYKNVTLYQ